MKAEELLKLKRFCQEIINRPRPIDDQPHEKRDGFLWCEDWEMIEILKYFFIGEATYLVEAPPKRLKRNPLWSKEEIIQMAKELEAQFKNVDEIIEYMRSIRDGNTSRV